MGWTCGPTSTFPPPPALFRRSSTGRRTTVSARRRTRSSRKPSPRGMPWCSSTFGGATTRAARSPRTGTKVRTGTTRSNGPPRSPGRPATIGTYGLSYPGAVQWLAAVESPPHLKAMVPAMTFSSPRNFFYAGGAWDLSWLSWIWNNIAPDARVKAVAAGPADRSRGTGGMEEVRARAGVPAAADRVPELRPPRRTTSTGWRIGPATPWWDWADLRRRYGKVDAAVFNISGWYDEAYGPEGAMTNFLGLLAARRGQKDPSVKIILGPWVHGGEAEDRSGERVFGEQARLRLRATRSSGSWTATCRASRMASRRSRASGPS